LFNSKLNGRKLGFNTPFMHISVKIQLLEKSPYSQEINSAIDRKICLVTRCCNWFWV